MAQFGQIAISTITSVELASAVRRRVLTRDLSAIQGDDAYARLLTDAPDFDVIELTDEIRSLAVELLLTEERIAGRLRGFDAIQLATAHRWFERAAANNIEPGVFVVADSALRDAARAIGVPVEDPEDYE